MFLPSIRFDYWRRCKIENEVLCNCLLVNILWIIQTSYSSSISDRLLFQWYLLQFIHILFYFFVFVLQLKFSDYFHNSAINLNFAIVKKLQSHGYVSPINIKIFDKDLMHNFIGFFYSCLLFSTNLLHCEYSRLFSICLLVYRFQTH